MLRLLARIAARIAMNLQDRAYAAAIFIVIGICCIGAYVALSGFFNAYPGGISITFNTATATTVAETNVQVPTDTPAPPSLTPLPSVPPTQFPQGFIPSVTPAVTR